MDAADSDDAYQVAKAFDANERVEESEELQEEESRLRRDGGTDATWVPDEESDHDLSDMEVEIPLENEESNYGAPVGNAATRVEPQKQRSKSESLNPIQKVCTSG